MLRPQPIAQSCRRRIRIIDSLGPACYYARAPRVGALSDDARLTSVAYIGPKSRTERARKTKIGTEVARALSRISRQGGVSKNQGVPPLPLPSLSLPSLSLPIPPLPSPPSTFPSLPLEVGPLFAARGSGGALKLPQRVRQTHFGAF